MTVVAHVTDLHLIERTHARRSLGAKARLRFLGAGRPIDAEARVATAREALRRAGRADHVVVTGDLTEDGHPEQFELLAELLAEAKLPAHSVTLVPGNHDLYVDGDAFEHALRGPLRAYAGSSRHGEALELGSTVIVPLATAKSRTLLRSAGELSAQDARALDALARGPRLRERTLLIAQHHPPLGYRNQLWNWIDGMLEHSRGMALLREHAHLHVVHGHVHRRSSYGLSPDAPHQVHCADSVLHGGEGVRFYEVGAGGLRALEAEAPAPARREAPHPVRASLSGA